MSWLQTQQMSWLQTQEMSWLQTQEMSWLQTQQMSWLQTSMWLPKKSASGGFSLAKTTTPKKSMYFCLFVIRLGDFLSKNSQNLKIPNKSNPNKRNPCKSCTNLDLALEVPTFLPKIASWLQRAEGKVPKLRGVLSQTRLRNPRRQRGHEPILFHIQIRTPNADAHVWGKIKEK